MAAGLNCNLAPTTMLIYCKLKVATRNTNKKTPTNDCKWATTHGLAYTSPGIYLILEVCINHEVPLMVREQNQPLNTTRLVPTIRSLTPDQSEVLVTAVDLRTYLYLWSFEGFDGLVSFTKRHQHSPTSLIRGFKTQSSE